MCSFDLPAPRHDPSYDNSTVPLEAFGLEAEALGSKLRWVPARDVARSAEIGEGTFAVVSKCSVKTSGGAAADDSQQVACKELKPWAVDDREQLRWFLSEAMLLSKLDHRNIVRHKGFGITSEDFKTVPFQLQELVGGGAMEDLLRTNLHEHWLTPKYGLSTGLKWCVEVAKAVEYLHGNTVNVVHRDLKLGNILLTKKDLSRASIRLADFGLAVELSEASPTAYLSKVQHQFLNSNFTSSDIEEGDCCYSLTGKTGSWLYMAPEVFLGLAYNHKADIFSLGVIITEILTGRLLSDSVLPEKTWEQAKKFADKVAKGFRPQLPADTPEELAVLIKECWAQDPNRRPVALEVLQRLDTFRRGVSVSAPLLHPVRVTTRHRVRFALRSMEKSIMRRLPSLRKLSRTLRKKFSKSE